MTIVAIISKPRNKALESKFLRLGMTLYRRIFSTSCKKLLVKIPQGTLQGTTGSNFRGDNFYKFFAIPYAKPPIGELRFKDPVPAEGWAGIRDATIEGSPCYARNEFTRTLEGSEDCLFLNVYTKKLPGSTSNLKPVMVFIHGGSFVSGSSKTSLYSPEFLITEDIVLVTLNYRLGALGFLRLKDPSLGVPGNAALKDQVLALKWVQSNIHYFNGDSSNVTLFGESAGSIAVHYHILSPKSKGLFHKGIMQSGTALDSLSMGRPFAKELAGHLGYDGTDEKTILQVLTETSVEELYGAQQKIRDLSRGSFIRAFAPSIEQPSDMAFIDRHPLEILRSGHYNQVTLMMGYTNREGMLVEFYKKYPTYNDYSLEDIVPWNIGIRRGTQECKSTVERFKEIYFRGPDFTDNIYMLHTDSLFFAGALTTIQETLSTSLAPLYFYRVSVESELNIMKKALKTQRKGVCHGDDLGYLFKSFLTPEEIKPGSIEDVSVRRFIKMWTNFAKYGNPTPDHENELNIVWKPVTKDAFNFLDIGDELKLLVDPESERAAFWREIYHINPKIGYL